jgi:hypothetical protein
MSALPPKVDFRSPHWHVRQVPTPEIPGAAVVASGRDAIRDVPAHISPTEPRGRSVTLTAISVGYCEAADTGSVASLQALTIYGIMHFLMLFFRPVISRMK